MARGAWLALLAAPFLLAAGAASAGPTTPEGRSGLPIWQEYGAGRTDGLSVGAYPLPPQAERDDRTVAEEVDGGAKERWLRRHYQWLRALGEVFRASNPGGDDRQDAKPDGRAAFAAPDRAGALRVGDMIVLYAAGDGDPIAPHLLDDGSRYEDPEIAGGETLDYIVRDRLTVESAKVVAEFFRPAAHGLRSAFGGLLTEGERRRVSRYDRVLRTNHYLADLENPGLSAPSTEAAADAPARQGPPPERVSMLDFFKGIALDILSAPTTYLLTLLALLGWAILRATVFSRN